MLTPPNLEENPLDIALRLYNANNPAGAADLLESIIRDHPKNAWARGMLANCYFNLDKFADAITAFEQAIEQERADPGKSYLTRLDQDLGQSHLEQLSWLLYRLGDTAYWRWLRLRSRRDLLLARDSYLEARDAFALTSPTLVRLALCQWRTGDKAGAISTAEGAIASDPNSRIAHAALVQFNIKTFRLRAAMRALRRAFALRDSLH